MTLIPPPAPQKGALVRSYLEKLQRYVKRMRPISGQGIQLKQTEGGITYSVSSSEIQNIVNQYLGTALGSTIIEYFGTATGFVQIINGTSSTLPAGSTGQVLVVGTSGEIEWETPEDC